jgi:hypothetical protein
MFSRRCGRDIVLLAVMAVVLRTGFAEAISGEEWRKLSPPSRITYVLGIVDAWTGLLIVQESLGTHDRAVTAFNDVVACVRDRAMAASRMTEVVEKYVSDNLGLTGKDMPDIVFAALSQNCR